MPQIYGYAFHSPLILRNLVPVKEYLDIYLDAKWLTSEMHKNVSPLIAKDRDKTLVILAGSLTILQAFFTSFADLDRKIKVILFDFPGLLNPFEDPLLKWIDCDHQAGGAWQITKTNLSSFENLLTAQKCIDAAGKDLIFRMRRFITPDRISEIESISAYIPNNYKDIVDQYIPEKSSEPLVAKDVSWRKKSFVNLIKDFIHNVPQDKRSGMLNVILDYQLSRISVKVYNTQIKQYVENNSQVKKSVSLVKKWMDDSKTGRLLHSAYLDYAFNNTRRCWRSILDLHNVNELDLLVVIAKQHRDTPDLAGLYADALQDIEGLPSDMYAPERSTRWSDSSLHYHPEPPCLTQMFDLS